MIRAEQLIFAQVRLISKLNGELIQSQHCNHQMNETITLMQNRMDILRDAVWDKHETIGNLMASCDELNTRISEITCMNDTMNGKVMQMKQECAARGSQHVSDNQTIYYLRNHIDDIGWKVKEIQDAQEKEEEKESSEERVLTNYEMKVKS